MGPGRGPARCWPDPGAVRKPDHQNRFCLTRLGRLLAAAEVCLVVSLAPAPYIENRSKHPHNKLPEKRS
eukprot:2644337-Pyramimonas_sp.AAC.1